MKHSIDYVLNSGIQPYIAEYTPIPHTSLFDEFEHHARFPISEDPSIKIMRFFPPSHGQEFTEKNLEHLKLYARGKKVVLNNLANNLMGSKMVVAILLHSADYMMKFLSLKMPSEDCSGLTKLHHHGHLYSLPKNRPTRKFAILMSQRAPIYTDTF